MHLSDILTERHQDITDVLAEWTGEGVYVNFSHLSKVGINPKSNFNTPLGIYAYPLDEMWSTIVRDEIPFAGERPFINVLRPRGRMLHVSRYGTEDLRADLAKLRQIAPEPLLQYAPLARKNHRHRSPAGVLWNLLRMMAHERDDLREFFSIPTDDGAPSGRANKGAVRWNALLRALGYDGVIDPKGTGLIHPAEPAQAVFLHVRAVVHEMTIQNVRKHLQQKKYHISSVWGFRNAMEDQNFGPLLRKQWQTLMRDGESHSFTAPFLRSSDPEVLRQIEDMLVRKGWKRSGTTEMPA